MPDLPLTQGPVAFEGAVSLEVTPDGVKPWRLPFTDLNLFDPPLVARGGQPSGVRVSFLTDSPTLELEFDAFPAPSGDYLIFDLLMDGVMVERRRTGVERQVLRYELPGAGKSRRIELY